MTIDDNGAAAFAADGAAGGAAGVTADWTRDWTAGLDDGARELVAVKGWRSPADLVQSYRHAERLIGRPADRLVALPGDGAGAAEWDAVYDRLGRPETPDGYALPERDHPLGEAARDGFLEDAHRLGLTPDQAAGVYERELALLGGAAETSEADIAAGRAAAAAELRGDWGGAFSENLALAKRAALAFGGDELIAALDSSGLGDSPVVLRALARIGQAIAEDRGVGRGGGFAAPTPEAARAQLQQMYGDNAFVLDLNDKARPGHAAAYAAWSRLVDATNPEGGR